MSDAIDKQDVRRAILEEVKQRLEHEITWRNGHGEYEYEKGLWAAVDEIEDMARNVSGEQANPAPSPVAPAIDAQPVDERSEFEHWCKTHCGLCDRDLHQTISGAYRSGYVDDMWDGWNGRAALSKKESQ